jgi:hypothetical protein
LIPSVEKKQLTNGSQTAWKIPKVGYCPSSFAASMQSIESDGAPETIAADTARTSNWAVANFMFRILKGVCEIMSVRKVGRDGEESWVLLSRHEGPRGKDTGENDFLMLL